MPAQLQTSQTATFPESEWSTLQDVMESEGVGPLATYIAAQPSFDRASSLFRFAQRAFLQRQWAGKSLDLYAELVQAGVAWHLEQALEAGDEGDEELSLAARQGAWAMSCALAFDLSDSWSDDGLPRERRHFRLGRAAARDCQRWALEAAPAPEQREKAHWACGMHELALGHGEAAEEYFLAARDVAAETAAAEEPADPALDRGWWMRLHEAFAALAAHRSGDPNAQERYAALLLELERGPDGLEEWTDRNARKAFRALNRTAARHL